VSGAPSPAELLSGWQLGPPVATIVAAGAAYALGVRRARAWPRRQTAAFALGLAVLLLALQSGVHAWGERLQSVHMAQHLLLCLVAAPLLVAGAPVTLALRSLRGRGPRRLAALLRSRGTRLAAHPATGFAALAAAMLATHLTPLYEAAARHALVHDAEHALLLAGGLLFWAPLVAADPVPRRPGAAGRIGWLLAAMVPMGVVGAVLLTSGPRSTSYERSAALLGVSPAADQAHAAVVMWLGGSLVMSIGLTLLVGAALREEEQRARRRETAGAW
jgi:putative membrane protein